MHRTLDTLKLTRSKMIPHFHTLFFGGQIFLAKFQYPQREQCAAAHAFSLEGTLVVVIQSCFYFQVERTDVSLSSPQGPFIRGTRFSGSSYYQFPSDTLPVNTDFTGKKSHCESRKISRTEYTQHGSSDTIFIFILFFLFSSDNLYGMAKGKKNAWH